MRYSWAYIDTLDAEYRPSHCSENASTIAPIGIVDSGKINFLKISYGNGAIFLHTTPLAFSNIELLDSAHVRYAEKALSHLQNGVIYWDTKSRVSRDVINNMNGNMRFDKESPLKYILAQPSLRWAWFSVFRAYCGVYDFCGQTAATNYSCFGRKNEYFAPIYSNNRRHVFSSKRTSEHLRYENETISNLCPRTLQTAVAYNGR